MAKKKIVGQRAFSFKLVHDVDNNHKGTVIIPAKNKEEALKIAETENYNIKR